MTPKPRPRYVLVDAVRGIAACAVMLYHFTGGDLRPGLTQLFGAQARWHVGVKVDVTHGPGALAVLLSAIALTIAASWALHVLVEAPAMRLAGRIRWWHGDPARAVTAP